MVAEGEHGQARTGSKEVVGDVGGVLAWEQLRGVLSGHTDDVGDRQGSGESCPGGVCWNQVGAGARVDGDHRASSVGGRREVSDRGGCCCGEGQGVHRVEPRGDIDRVARATVYRAVHRADAK